MTNEIEGMQGDNGPVDDDYQPMRPEDPANGEKREPIALGGQDQPARVEHAEPDAETVALLEEASDAVVEAIERRAEPGYTPVPQGGEIVDQFMVHDDDDDPRRAKAQEGAADPHALMYLGTQRGARLVLEAFLEEERAITWASSSPDRRLWKVRVVTFDQPMVAVQIPSRVELMTEDEARTHDQLEDDDE
jgi:hypothetical protein